MILSALCMTLFSIAGAAYGAQTASDAQPSPAVFLKFGLTGVTGDQQNLYVMAGGQILQYDLTGASLLKKVDLPNLPSPPDATPPQATTSNNFPPPPHHPHMPQGLWAGNNSLYVLAGPFIYIYSTPGLSLKNTVKLPKPQLPQSGN